MAGKRFPLARRFRYWFEESAKRGMPTLVGWLMLAWVIVIFLTATTVVLLAPEDSGENGGWVGVLWESLLRAIDPGTMGGDRGSAAFLAIMLAVTLSGIFLVSALISVLTAGLQTTFDRIRGGRSPIVESQHVVVLGWSDQIYLVLSELTKFAESTERMTVAILAEVPHTRAEDEIRSRLGGLGKLRVILRTGSPRKAYDIEIVSPRTARAIIILPREGSNTDVETIKSLLLLNHLEKTSGLPPVVACVKKSANLDAARMTGGHGAHIVDSDDLAVRLLTIAYREPGLSTVCSDLLDFDGSEIYLTPFDSAVSISYAGMLKSLETGCPIGIRRSNGDVLLNPPAAESVNNGDRIILIAEDARQAAASRVGDHARGNRTPQPIPSFRRQGPLRRPSTMRC